MSKHTPAPWTVEVEAYRITVSAQHHELSEQFLPEFEGPEHVEQLEEYLANAHLMAAAPKLLAALQQVNDCLVKCLTGGEVSAKAAGKAIENAAIVMAQAKGEQPNKCCEPTADEEALLAAGEYTPEELWGGRRPTCPKCIGDEQP